MEKVLKSMLNFLKTVFFRSGVKNVKPKPFDIGSEEYRCIHDMICFGRNCHDCKINHNKPCYKTPPEELYSYARELFKESDSTFLYATKLDTMHKIIFYRFISGVEYL